MLTGCFQELKQTDIDQMILAEGCRGEREGAPEGAHRTAQ